MDNFLTQEQHLKLIAEIKYGMAIRGWKVKDLAKAARYGESAIYRLCNIDLEPSGDCAYEVMRVLGIKWEDLK